MTKITEAYGIDNPLQEVFPVPVKSKRQPTERDSKAYNIGQIWVDTETAQVYALSKLAGGKAVWALLSHGDHEIDTLTGDSGGEIHPTNGNITLKGGVNIKTTGTGSEIKIDVKNAMVDTLTGDTGGEIHPTNGNITLKGGSNLKTTGSGSEIKVDMKNAISLPVSVTAKSIYTVNNPSRLILANNEVHADGSGSDADLRLRTKGEGFVKINSTGLAMTKEGSKIGIKGGAATSSIGQTVLVAGKKTILNTTISVLDRIFVDREGIGLSTAIGTFNVVKNLGVSFEIHSLRPGNSLVIEPGDLSIVNYLIVRQL